LSAFSQRRILDRPAPATSRLRIDSMTKCSRAVRGLGSGSGMVFPADFTPSNGVVRTERLNFQLY
jgi:hypothetical protein